MSKGLQIKQKFSSGFYKSDKHFKISAMLSDMSNFHLKKKYEIKANINKPRINRYAKQPSKNFANEKQSKYPCMAK